MKVYQAINAVQAGLGKVGIAKNRESDKFKFRGIDDVFNAINPLLSEHQLCILPRMISRTMVERMSSGSKALFYVTVEAEFDLVSAEDGSKHTIRTYGEAMDLGDKATNKAMSAAYKYACFQAFAIPTVAIDPDEETHEVSTALEQYETEHLDWMREAALDGLPALEEAFKKLPASTVKAEFWEKHSKSLKEAANGSKRV